MTDNPVYSSDVAFTPVVKAIQARKGSRASYAKMEQRGSRQTTIPADLKLFIRQQRSVFLGTAKRLGVGLELSAAHPAAFRGSAGRCALEEKRRSHCAARGRAG